MEPKTMQSTGNLAQWLMAIALLVIAGVGIWKVMMSESEELVGENQLKEEAIQAVFLSDGQVYFGDITEIEEDTLVLENVFYLQVDQDLQAGEENSQQSLSLAKLGAGELHGPEDKMVINRDQVLFWENLKNDSAVVKAIDSYVPGTQSITPSNTNKN